MQSSFPVCRGIQVFGASSKRYSSDPTSQPVGPYHCPKEAVIVMWMTQDDALQLVSPKLSTERVGPRGEEHTTMTFFSAKQPIRKCAVHPRCTVSNPLNQTIGLSKSGASIQTESSSSGALSPDYGLSHHLPPEEKTRDWTWDLLWGKRWRFLLQIHQNPLQWLHRTKDASRKFLHWSSMLQDKDFETSPSTQAKPTLGLMHSLANTFEHWWPSTCLQNFRAGNLKGYSFGIWLCYWITDFPPNEYPYKFPVLKFCRHVEGQPPPHPNTQPNRLKKKFFFKTNRQHCDPVKVRWQHTYGRPLTWSTSLCCVTLQGKGLAWKTAYLSGKLAVNI